MLTKCAFLTPPISQAACRGLHPAVLAVQNRLKTALFQEVAGTALLLTLEQGRVENPLFLCSTASGNHFFNKRALSLSSGLSGSWVDSERCAASSLSRPRFPLLPVAKRLRFGDALPLHASLASPSRDKGSSVVMSQNTLPSGPSSMTPHCCTSVGMLIVPLVPLAQSLGAWLELPNPSRWLIRTVRVGYVIQFARRLPRFSSVPKICDNPRHHCSVRGYCCPVGEGCNQACPSS